MSSVPLFRTPMRQDDLVRLPCRAKHRLYWGAMRPAPMAHEKTDVVPASESQHICVSFYTLCRDPQ